MNNDNTKFGFSKTVRGTIALALGFMLFLYVLNIAGQWLNGFFVLVALALMFYGFIESGLLKKISDFVDKK